MPVPFRVYNVYFIGSSTHAPDCKIGRMGKYEKLLDQILRGSSDANVAFDDLCQLLRRLGFDEHIRGSHHNFRRTGVEQKVNLQKDGSKAKAYQVKQVRTVIVENKLAGDDK